MTASIRIALSGACSALLLIASSFAAEPATGTLPTDPAGRALNLDFESGDLRDWTAEGDAFAKQPIEGDTVAKRRTDMQSRHQGRFWIGGYERAGDVPQGTLTSAPFKVTQPYATFLVGGGHRPSTRVELVDQATGKAIFTARGNDREEMQRTVVDLTQHQGKLVFVRLVDQDSGGWGHVNFDDFRFLAEKPTQPPGQPSAQVDVYKYAGLSPDEAAKAMTLPPGFTATAFAGEPDVKQPVAMAIDDRGRVWVCENYSYPVRVPENEAHDRILIFEDVDGDGRFDTRKVFYDKLNMVSGIELGFGGVYVGSAPEFLFIPDADGDDRPDGPPQVLLDGWGLQDTHETLNTFTWGPDGWLYGCHGVFTHSLVGKPGTPDKERTPINAGVWRYHPTRHKFEVFAEGTSNPWGIAFDEHGQLFITACVIPHLYHMIQGGRYQRQAGTHFNPYTYDDIKTIAVHRHWVGDRPHLGNSNSGSAGGGHAHAGAMIYQGGAWPEEYSHRIFMNNIHGARLNMDQLTKTEGSGFSGDRAPDFLLSNDSWSQMLNLQYGPDGQMYVIDWYDRNQCHHRDINGHDRSNGRIFKINYGRSQPVTVDLKKQSDGELVVLLLDNNEWYARHARRILQERGPKPKAVALLKTILHESANEALRLRALWCLHALGAADNTELGLALTDRSPWVRGWAVQLLREDPRRSTNEWLAMAVHQRSRDGVTSALAVRHTAFNTFVDLAQSDPSPVVRLYLASACQRIPLADRWSILEGLVSHAEDAADHNLPLMYWYAAEPLAETDPSRLLALATGGKIPLLVEFSVRRIAALGTPEAIELLVDTLGEAKDDARRQLLVDGLNQALRGRRQVPMPKNWSAVYASLRALKNRQLDDTALALAATFGDPAAAGELLEVVKKPSAESDRRVAALAALVKVRSPKLDETLLTLLDDDALRAPALRALAGFDNERTPQAILALYPRLRLMEKQDALNTLASRVPYAEALLAAVERKEVPAADLSADLVRQMRNFKNAPLDQRIEKAWGTMREVSADKAKAIEQYKKLVGNRLMPPADPSLGRFVFAKTCAQCHTLFGTGGKVGPELTGSNRANLDYLLSNLLDPSAVIGKDYIAQVILLADGRVLTGIVKGEDADAITLATANETVVVPKNEIESREPSVKSMMPDDILKPIADHEVRSLVAYLAGANQVAMAAPPKSSVVLFNGKDLIGWEGNMSLWSVEQGELVGRTTGLKQNEFLRHELVLGDFRLSCQVKLVDNRGNSGIQFRSEARPHGEMAGYQADIGAGWWGKLYEENGRALLWKESGEKFVKPGEWNRYEIVAVGSKLRTWINGQLSVDLDDPDGARRGIIALQLHSGGPTEVRYRDFELQTDPGPEALGGSGNVGNK